MNRMNQSLVLNDHKHVNNENSYDINDNMNRTDTNISPHGIYVDNDKTGKLYSGFNAFNPKKTSNK
jgi:hypothetical protein